MTIFLSTAWNIFVDTAKFIYDELIVPIKQTRQSNKYAKVLLYPLELILHFVRIFIYNIGTRSMDLWEYLVSTVLHSLILRIFTSVPNDFVCFNRPARLIFFVDIFLLVYGSKIIIPPHIRVFYIVTKFFALLLPFLTLSPNQRVLIWFLSIFILVFEILLAALLIRCYSFATGFTARKHIRSTRRTLTKITCAVFYPLIKMLIFLNYWCFDEKKANDQYTALSIPNRGSLLDFDYVRALLERDDIADLRYGILFLLVLSSLGVYSIVLAGWSSNSKYAFIGALRSAAQMISYEVAISLVILPPVLMAGSLNLTMVTHMQSITTWFLYPLLPIAIFFTIAMLAETNRTPFDLPEAEAELVAGYNVDYSALPFAMFFLGEYCNMLLISVMCCLLFIGGASGVFPALFLASKAAVLWVFFIIVRATLPRYRYDQLMDIGWKVFLPVCGGLLILEFGLLILFDGLPVTGELSLSGIYY